MNSIFFLIPFLLIASIGIFQDTFALETYRGYDYQTVENPDGTITWTGGLTPWILDNGQYKEFVFTDGTTKTVETEFGSVRLNADGSYSFYKNGKITESELFTDKIVAKYADISNLNSWTYPNSINNDVPDVSWDGSTLTSTKSSSIGILDYKYVLNDGKWKTQLEATNLSALTTKAFGFDQIIDLNRDTIMFNGIQRNLDNFNNTTFDKQFLIDNKAKVIDFLNDVSFDFDLGFENLYSITILDTGANKSRLIFDYRTSVPLLPGETLIIDPTYSSNNPVIDGEVFSISSTGAACSTTGSTIDSAGTQSNAYIGDSDVSIPCYRGFFKYDISSIPSDAIITDSVFQYDITTSTNPKDVAFTGLTVDPSTATADQLYDNILAATVLTTSADTAVGDNKSTDLTSVGDTYFQGRIASGDASIGFRFNDETRDSTSAHNVIIATEEDAGATPKPTLVIVYSVGSPPNPVTVLNDVNLSTNSLDLVWDAPTSFGSGTFQTYTINYTTPWGEPVTFLANSTNLYYNVTGLTFGTDYSFRVAARTEIPGNNTGAYILNITTTSTTYSLPPTSLVATSNSATQIDLQWVASAMDNILGYKIEFEAPSGTGWSCAPTAATCNSTNALTFFNHTGLSTNIIYNYRVYALNGTGTSTVSNTYAMTTYHLPDAVTDLTGSATDLSTIDLSWTAPTSYAPAITGYMINGTTPTGEPVDILNSNTGTTATTATALNLLIGQEYSFRVSPITVHGKNASGNIWNGSTIQTFVIGNLSNPDITNDDDFSIFFDRTDVNASAIELDVTYPNSYDLSCDFDYKYARTNQTYSGLTTVPDGADDQVATFTLINATGDLVQVRCWDTITGDESIYVITITDFPFLEQVNNLRNGEYGTFFQIGAFDGVMLIIIFLGMVGLNRTTPIVGVIFVVITVFTMQYFGLITYPIIMYPAMIMMIVWAFVSTRKDD